MKKALHCFRNGSIRCPRGDRYRGGFDFGAPQVHPSFRGNGRCDTNRCRPSSWHSHCFPRVAERSGGSTRRPCRRPRRHRPSWRRHRRRQPPRPIWANRRQLRRSAHPAPPRPRPPPEQPHVHRDRPSGPRRSRTAPPAPRHATEAAAYRRAVHARVRDCADAGDPGGMHGAPARAGRGDNLFQSCRAGKDERRTCQRSERQHAAVGRCTIRLPHLPAALLKSDSAPLSRSTGPEFSPAS